MIDVPFSSWETINRNERNCKHADACFLCGKGIADISSAAWVEMTTENKLVPADTSVTNSMGCFPVGSECKKKVPASYLLLVPSLLNLVRFLAT